MAAQAAVQEPATQPAKAAELLRTHGFCLVIRERVILDNISFELAEGEILGVLGPNGAGKSSLMRCVLGMLRPSLGTLWFEGKKVAPGTTAMLKATGVVFQRPSIDIHLTVRDNLTLAARLYGLQRREIQERTAELLAFMELDTHAKDPASTLSGGMQRRLEIARALIHSPRLLVLDEPTSSLDIQSYDRTWKCLMALRKMRGLSVLVSTHQAYEAEACDRLLVLDRGHVVTCDTPAQLLSRIGGDIVTFETRNPEAVAARLLERFDLVSHAIEGAVVIEHPAGPMLIPRVAEIFPEGQFQSISVRRPSMADVFLKLTGRVLAT